LSTTNALSRSKFHEGHITPILCPTVIQCQRQHSINHPIGDIEPGDAEDADPQVITKIIGLDPSECPVEVGLRVDHDAVMVPILNGGLDLM
jgi:hypothetical protein